MPDGPIEDNPWPRRLRSRVTSPDAARLHGFDVVGDLARHYSFAEIGFVAIRGEAPTPAEGRLFELALSLLCVTPIAEAPAHVASLSRTCGTTPTSAMATGFVVLAEQTRWQLEQWSPILAWLRGPTTAPPPASALERSADLQQSIIDLLPDGSGTQLRAHKLCREAAGLALLHEIGLADDSRLAACLMFARTPGLFAEVVAAKPGALREYPIATPDFAYEPPERS